MDAIQNGADEVDYVINITELKEGNYDYIREEMRQIVAECRKAMSSARSFLKTAT